MSQSYRSGKCQWRNPNVYTLISSCIKCYVICSIDFWVQIESRCIKKINSICFYFSTPASRMLRSYRSGRSQRRIPNVYTLISTCIKCYVICSIGFIWVQIEFRCIIKISSIYFYFSTLSTM